ncbi:MAG: glycine cleavage system aminomethyltransferase GcvT [Actinobacteria bacterium]|nr:glycine cleavage system aminomethyltransferase GcvT [Actinomycetota bacterium]
MEAGALKRTPLYDAHVEAGAKLVDFSGWEMPVEYAGIRSEHEEVRTGCGVFDVSHMGEVESEGPGAGELLQRLLTNDISELEVGAAIYSCVCREDAGVLDDVFTYRLADKHFLTVTNASNHDKVLAWFERHAGDFDARVSDHLESYAMLAVQGPKAREVVGSLAQGELPARHRIADMNLGTGDALVCGTGYTGEDGVEVLVPPDEAAALWEQLVLAGATPAGLGARDTLRMEVNYCLYGNELSEERTPIEAALDWALVDGSGFIGEERCAEQMREGTEELLAPFVIDGEGIARQGNPVKLGDEAVGEVTSGTLSPSLGKGIGMAYVRTDLAEPGTEVEIDVRGRRRAARIGKRPLYKPAG